MNVIEEQAPPLRPRIEQVGEKVGGVVIIAIAIAIVYLALTAQRPLNLTYMGQAWETLSGPAVLTIFVTGVSYFGGMGIGILLGWARTGRSRIARGIATFWIESFRGTPLLVQLLILVQLFSFYNPGRMPVQTRLVVTGILALLINTSAYQGEIFRAGLQSVAAGQVEAAKTIGLTRWGSMRHVVLPQAIRVVVPPLMNEFVALLKASSLLALSGVQELTYYAKLETGRGSPVTEVFVVVILLYLLMTVPLAKLVGWLERRFRIPGLGMQQETRTGRQPRGARGTVARLVGVDFPGLSRIVTRQGRSRPRVRPSAEPS